MNKCNENQHSVKGKCRYCKKQLKLNKAVKLFYFSKTYYFCNTRCYIKFVKLKHPTSKKEWDKLFSKLSKKAKSRYYVHLREVRKTVKHLSKQNGWNYHLKGMRHAYIWQRPKAD